MSEEAKAYHHKWIGDEKDLRDRYEVMQDYAEKYHKEQLLLHNVVGRSEQLPQIHGLIKCECGKVYDVDIESHCLSCGN